MKQTCKGSCHFGAVRFEADIDLSMDDAFVGQVYCSDGRNDNYRQAPSEVRHL